MTFKVDFIRTEPTFRRVSLLAHPQIPGPLGGVNPRSILGESWWDEVRQEAYRLNNYHCHACAGAPDDDPLNQTLDAHECYDIDWMHGTASYRETVALCRCCHSFIHAGRSANVLRQKQLRHVLERGMTLLREEGLQPYWRTYVLFQQYCKGKMAATAIREARSLGLVIPGDAFGLPDSRWVLRLKDHDYRRNPNNGRIEMVS